MLTPDTLPPVTPGEILLEEFLRPMGLTQQQFAKHLGWTQPKINDIIKGKRAITVETALAFSEVLGPSPEFWLNAQRAVDLWEARQSRTKTYERLLQAC